MIPFQLLAGLFVAVTLAPGTAPRSSGPQGQEGGKKGYEPAVKLPDDFVRFARVPDGGVEPRIETFEDGHVVLYFKGSDSNGDLLLTRTKDEAKTFEPSVQLNSLPGSVLARELGDSGSIDLGPDGRAHVLWIEGGEKPSLRYVCEKPGGGLAPVLDLGSPSRLAPATAIALDPQGKVYVFFAAEDSNSPHVEGETPGLRMWMRTSEDGATFGEPIAIDPKADGVSESSAFTAHVDQIRGTVFVFYVTTGRKFAPEVRLLSSEDSGGRFTSRKIELLLGKNVPPRSRLHLSQEFTTERTVGPPRTIMSWDCYARAFWGVIDPSTNKLQGMVPIEPKQENPPWRRFRAQGEANGTEYLLAWLEQPVGDRSAPPVLCWRVWYSDGLLPLGSGRVPADPIASAPAVFANKGPGFTILF